MVLGSVQRTDPLADRWQSGHEATAAPWPEQTSLENAHLIHQSSKFNLGLPQLRDKQSKEVLCKPTSFLQSSVTAACYPNMNTDRIRSKLFHLISLVLQILGCPTGRCTTDHDDVLSFCVSITKRIVDASLLHQPGTTMRQFVWLYHGYQGQMGS